MPVWWSLSLIHISNILVTTKKDFETHNRKKFCARIATGDYAAIIMGHSQFERIPISRERQERLLYEQILSLIHISNKMNNPMTYIQNGDYLIPDLKLSQQPEKPLGKYGSCLLYTSRCV